MERAGKPLDQWQQDAVTLLLAFREDGLWACFEYCEICSRQNGKGAILEARALAGFLLLGEALIMWSAHEYKTSMEAFRRMRSLLWALGTKVNDNLVVVDGIHIKISNTNGDEGFERLDTEQRIKFIARSKGSGRGFTGDLNIIDEAYAYTTEHQDALGPTLLAVPNPQFVYASSPPLASDTGEILYGLRERAEAILKSGEDEALGYRDWGMAGDLDDLDSIDIDDHVLWAATNPALCNGRLTIPKIQKLRKMLRSKGGRGFARECLGLWPRRRKTGGVIDMERWAKLVDERVQVGLSPAPMVGRVGFAVDVSPDRSQSTISAAGRRGDGLLMVETIKAGVGTRWVLPFMKELLAAQDPVAVVIDPGSAAGSLLTDLAKLIEAANDARTDGVVTTLVEMSARDYAQACGALMDLLEAEEVRHLGQASLTLAAEGAATRTLGDAWAWDRRRPDADITPLVAGTLALAGFKDHEHDDQVLEPWVYFEDDDDPDDD